MGTYELQDVYVGDSSIFHIYGDGMNVAVRTLSCHNTAVIEIPDHTIFESDKGKIESVISCSFTLSEEGELRMPATVTLTGANNQFSGKV